MFKIYDEPDSPSKGACLRYVMNRNRQMSGPSLSKPCKVA